MTFFACPGAFRGRIGPPQVRATAFAVPSASIDFWSKRLSDMKIAATASRDRFGERVIAFMDPDGMQLEIVASASAPADRIWKSGDVPIERAIRGFHSVTLSIEAHEHT